jgi:hypothetical protein
MCQNSKSIMTTIEIIERRVVIIGLLKDVLVQYVLEVKKGHFKFFKFFKFQLRYI